MKLNCKPGDLAIVVGLVKVPHLNGMLVEVLDYVPPDHVWMAPNGIRRRRPETSVAVRSCGSAFTPLNGRDTPYMLFLPRNLRPIRDQPGDDETLAWAGHPTEMVVA